MAINHQGYPSKALSQNIEWINLIHYFAKTFWDHIIPNSPSSHTSDNTIQEKSGWEVGGNVDHEDIYTDIVTDNYFPQIQSPLTMADVVGYNVNILASLQVNYLYEQNNFIDNMIIF